MSKKIKTKLCKLKKSDIKKLLPALGGELKSACYICGSCARGASKKKLLCNPLAIELDSSDDEEGVA